MAAKFLGLEEAATQLGVTPDQLVEMRANGEIHGYRDGASWKFKPEEVERIVVDRGGGMAASAAGGSDVNFDDLNDDLNLDLDPEPTSEGDSRAGASSILVSEQSVGHAKESASSTIIGKEGAKLSPAESDLRLVPEGDSSDVTIDDDGDILLAPSATTPSGLTLESGSSDLLSGDSGDLGSGDGRATPLKLATGSGTGELDAVSDVTLGSSDLDLADDDEEIEADDDDDELVLAGSDVTLNASDSGINLASPTDSGLSLEEEPIDVGGSSASSLELPEDDEIITLEDDADPEDATALKQDEEFLLSPYDQAAGEEADESDSGSQVIALDESGAFGDAATMIGEPALLPEDSIGQLEVVDMGAMGAPGAMGVAGIGGAMMAPGMVPGMTPGMVPGMAPAGMQAAATEEQVFGGWSTAFLGVIFMFALLGSLITMDVLRNIWQWNNSSVGSSLTDAIVSAFFPP